MCLAYAPHCNYQVVIVTFASSISVLTEDGGYCGGQGLAKNGLLSNPLISLHLTLSPH